MIIARLVGLCLRRRITRERLDRALKKLDFPGRARPASRGGNTVRVSCVQRRLRLVKSPEQYVDMLFSFAQQAYGQGSRLLVFPEYNFFDLFGLVPGFSLLDRFFRRTAGGSKASGGGKDPVAALMANIFNEIAAAVESCCEIIISRLALGFGLYIYSGSYLTKEGGRLYNAGSLFGPDGGKIGTQKKIHLTDFEAALGLCPHCGMEVYRLPIGSVAFPICMDATYFETFRVARDKGADVVILPIANMEEYDLWKSLRGIWTRVQETYTYGLKSSLNGWIAGMHFTGKAGVFAPLELTPGKDGVIALADHWEGDCLVTADINFSELEEARKNAEYYGDSNPDFERYYIKRAYTGL